MAESSWVIVFAKAPVAGRVKTRLAADLGEARALQVYRDMAEHQWRWLLKAREDARFCLALCFDPPEAEAIMRTWLPHADAYLPQCHGNLGYRIATACAWALGKGGTALTVIGSDCPGFGPGLLLQGFRSSGHAPFALGPAMDGGFYALTLTPQARPLLARLAEIPWSSPQTTASLVQVAMGLGLIGATLPELRDLDTLEDLRFYQREPGWPTPPG